MAKTHELKTLPIYFDAVLRGDKTFEIRKNDRDFQTGDTLVLKEWDPAKQSPPVPWGDPVPTAPRLPGEFTGAELRCVVSYVLIDVYEKFGVKPGFAVLGITDVSVE